MNYYNFFSPKLTMWYIESYKEKNITVTNQDVDFSYALYPKRFYENVENISTETNKQFDFCFIGGLHTDRQTLLNRSWILPFIQKYFTNNSYLQFTDKQTKINYKKLGNFDKTLEINGFVPKEHPEKNRNYFDTNYFTNMCKSNFCLCPSGDLFYSMRFYEALMCKTIPIVNTINETFRSKAESLIDYKYYLSSDEDFIYHQSWADHNYDLFLKHHTLNHL
jgi:hypothetical protein